MSRPGIFGCVVVLFSFPSLLSADKSSTPNSPCWEGPSGARCKVIFLTDFGVYYMPLPSDRSGGRLVGDWGVLFNLSETDGIGATLFASFDDDEFRLGPEVRYRRWLNEDQSLEIGIGIPLVVEPSQNSLSSPQGFIKFNALHWLGIAVRSEIRRTEPINVIFIDPLGNFFQPQPEPSRFHLSAGVEFGWWPGLSLTAAGGVALLILALSFAGK